MSNYLKNIGLLIAAAMALTSVAACTMVDEPNPPVMQAAAPKDNAQKQKLYTYLLGEQGIDVIKIGETGTVVMDSNLLFAPNSANFRPAYASHLKIVARLLNSYEASSVAVTAYTHTPGDAERALTEKQAQKIVVYLKKQGIDTRLIYAKGYGNLYPVTLDKQNGQLNRRIEIKWVY